VGERGGGRKGVCASSFLEEREKRVCSLERAGDNRCLRCVPSGKRAVTLTFLSVLRLKRKGGGGKKRENEAVEILEKRGKKRKDGPPGAFTHSFWGKVRGL